MNREEFIQNNIKKILISEGFSREAAAGVIERQMMEVQVHLRAEMVEQIHLPL